MYTYVNGFSLLLGVVVETEHTENLPQAPGLLYAV